MAASVAVIFSTFYGLHPSLLTVLTQTGDEEMDINKLHEHSQCLVRWKALLFAGCTLNIFVALLIMMVGVSFLLSKDVVPYSAWFIYSIPLVSLIYLCKASITIFGTIRNHQRALLLVSSRVFDPLSVLMREFIANSGPVCAVYLHLLELRAH